MRDRGQVAADADVDRLALLHCGGDGSVNLLVCILQVVDHCLVAGDILEAAELLREIGNPDGMMQDPITPVVVAVGSPDDAHHGEVLAEGAR